MQKAFQIYFKGFQVNPIGVFPNQFLDDLRKIAEFKNFKKDV